MSRRGASNDPAGARSRMGGVARGSSANLAGALVLGVTTFLVTVVVTRSLSKEAAGVFFSATSVFVLATSIGQLGTNTGLVYFISRAQALGDSGAVRGIVRTATRPVLATAVALAAGIFAAAEPLARLIVPSHPADAVPYLRILALFIPLVALEQNALSASRGLGSMRPNVIVEQIARPLLQLVMVAAAVALGGASALAWGWALCYLPAAVFAYLWWRRLEPRPSSLAVGPSRGEFWAFSGPRALASIGQIALQRFDIVLVGAIAGPAQAAVYAAATRFLVVGQMGNRSISAAVQPRLGASLARGDLERTNLLYRTTTGWLILVTWPVYLILIIFGDRLLLVFGQGYDAGSGVLYVLAGVMFFATAAGMVDMVLNMAGRTSWNLINVAVSVVVTFGLDLILIPRIGILGAAIGWACGILASNGLALAQVGFAMKIHPFGRAGSTAAAICVVSFGVVPLLVRLVLGNTVAALAVSLALAVPTFAAGVWWRRRPLALAAFRSLRRGGGGARSAQDPQGKGRPSSSASRAL